MIGHRLLLFNLLLLLCFNACSLFNPDKQDLPDVLIAYSVKNNQVTRYDRDIMLTNIDGSKDRALFDGTSSDFEPKFNMAGDGVFFLSDAGFGGRNLFFADTSGAVRTPLTDGSYIYSYDVSPSGDQIAFSDNSSGETIIYHLDMESGIMDSIAQGSDPVFVDGGSAIIWICDSAGRNLRKVTLGTTDTLDITTQAANSQLICFGAQRERLIVWSKPDHLSSYAYYLLDNEGQFLAKVTFGSGISGQPALSPSGSQFVYIGWSAATEAYEVYIDNVGNAIPFQVTKAGLRATDPIFFDDDNYVLYVQEEGSGFYLYQVESAGKHETKISRAYTYAPEYYDVAEF